MEIRIGQLKLRAEDASVMMGGNRMKRTSIIIDASEVDLGEINKGIEVDCDELKVALEALERTCFR